MKQTHTILVIWCRTKIYNGEEMFLSTNNARKTGYLYVEFWKSHLYLSLCTEIYRKHIKDIGVRPELKVLDRRNDKQRLPELDCWYLIACWVCEGSLYFFHYWRMLTWIIQAIVPINGYLKTLTKYENNRKRACMEISWMWLILIRLFIISFQKPHPVWLLHLFLNWSLLYVNEILRKGCALTGTNHSVACHLFTKASDVEVTKQEDITAAENTWPSRYYHYNKIYKSLFWSH